MEKTLFEIATKIVTPISLASIVVIALYLIYKLILNIDISHHSVNENRLSSI